MLINVWHTFFHISLELVCVCVLPTTILWSASELWGGRFPTSDSDPYGTYALSLIVTYWYLSLPAVWCPSRGGSPLLPQHPLHWRPKVSSHRIIRPNGRHLSPSQNTDVPCIAPILRCLCSPTLTLPRSRNACWIHVAIVALPLPKSLLLWPSDTSPLPPPRHLESPPSLITRLYRINIKNNP